MTTLEKIREEIEQTTDDYNPARDAFDSGYVMATRDVLQIIDKYAEQEPCDDAISRQAVLEMAYDMSEIDGEHFTGPCMVVDVEDIQKLPSVRPQEQTKEEQALLQKWRDNRGISIKEFAEALDALQEPKTEKRDKE